MEKKYRLEGKWAYLNHYLGKPFSVSAGMKYIEGTLHDLNPEYMTATIMPTIMYGPQGQPYIEYKVPTTLSLHLLDLTKQELVVQPLRSLEERVSMISQVNTPRAKIGFGA